MLNRVGLNGLNNFVNAKKNPKDKDAVKQWIDTAKTTTLMPQFVGKLDEYLKDLLKNTDRSVPGDQGLFPQSENLDIFSTAMKKLSDTPANTDLIVETAQSISWGRHVDAPVEQLLISLDLENATDKKSMEIDKKSMEIMQNFMRKIEKDGHDPLSTVSNVVGECERSKAHYLTMNESYKKGRAVKNACLFLINEYQKSGKNRNEFSDTTANLIRSPKIDDGTFNKLTEAFEYALDLHHKN